MWEMQALNHEYPQETWGRKALRILQGEMENQPLPDNGFQFEFEC